MIHIDISVMRTIIIVLQKPEQCRKTKIAPMNINILKNIFSSLVVAFVICIAIIIHLLGYLGKIRKLNETNLKVEVWWEFNEWPTETRGSPTFSGDC